jgi:hypothetical protein
MPVPPHKFSERHPHSKICSQCGYSELDSVHKLKSRKLSDPLLRATRKANAEFNKTPLGRLQRLCADRSKWTRRATIARNKLAEIQDKIDTLATELANKVGGKP